MQQKNFCLRTEQVIIYVTFATYLELIQDI